MHTAERDQTMARLRPPARNPGRHWLQDMRTQSPPSSDHRRMARQMLATHDSNSVPDPAHRPGGRGSAGGHGAAPERLYLIGVDGRAASHGGAGPHSFHVEA
jgi:hypothetical protein